jgi:hypothetical protein
VTDSQRRLKGYLAANLECAKIIAQDPAKYPPDSLPAIWAAMVLAKAAKQPEPATRRAA